jgi:hypothetical protein
MSLPLAVLIPGLLLFALGLPLALGSQWAGAYLQGFPRSRWGAGICFGSGIIWFLIKVWNLPVSDNGEYHVPLFIGFGVAAVLATRCAPDFLAVRGLAIVTLLAVMPMLMAGYMNFSEPELFFQKAFLYGCVVVAMWLGAQPWRARDFLGWMFARTRRTRGCGYAMVAYGLLLCGIAFLPTLAGK